MTLISDLHRGHYIQTRLNVSVTTGDISFPTTSTIVSAGDVDWTDHFLPGGGETITVEVVDGTGTNDGDYVTSTVTATTITLTTTPLVVQASPIAEQRVMVSLGRDRDFTGNTYTDLDFTLNYVPVDGFREWSYDDSTKIFNYEGDHTSIHKISWSISIAGTGSPAGELLDIGLKRQANGVGDYVLMPESMAYRQFASTDVGHFGSDFLYPVEVGDNYKMNVRCNGNLAVRVQNLLMAFHVNDVIS